MLWTRPRSLADSIVTALPIVFALIGCTVPSATESNPTAHPDTAARMANVPGGAPVPAVLPERVVAFGDVHGDFDALIKALTLARVVDRNRRWNGGRAILVQTGDLLDKTDNDRRVLDFLVALQGDARAAGGDVVLIVGNHEQMNIEGNFGYVTAASCDAFSDIAGLHPERLPAAIPLPEKLPPGCRLRAAAFAPGAPYARILGEFDVVQRVGDSLFVHGGVLPEHLEHYSIDQLNSDYSSWARGDRAVLNTVSREVTWTRDYSEPPDGALPEATCRKAAAVLAAVGARRIIVGHTVQSAINAVCNGTVWRIDTGMSSYYGGNTQVLEIRPDGLSVLGP